jgi:RNA polymerase sigma-70 factor (ECF subfamily)
MRAVTRENTIRYQLIGLIPHLRRYARGLTKDPDKADDLVQEDRIIYNRWIDNLRRRKTRLTKLIILSEQNKFKAGDSSAGDQMDAMLDLQGALDRLDDEHRAALMLIGVEGYSYAEAAAILEVPPGTVASRVARARTKLSEMLYQRRGESFRLKAVNKSREENES